MVRLHTVSVPVIRLGAINHMITKILGMLLQLIILETSANLYRAKGME